MIVREVEAKNYWCPAARLICSTGSSYNRASLGHPVSYCIGSKCMVWVEVTPAAGKCGLVNKSS